MYFKILLTKDKASFPLADFIRTKQLFSPLICSVTEQHQRIIISRGKK